MSTPTLDVAVTGAGPLGEAVTLADLNVPLRALRLLAAEFPDLPAPCVDLSTIFPDRLCLRLHEAPGAPPLAAFEAWRAALGVPDGEVTGRFQCGGVWVLTAEAWFEGARVELSAYADLDVPTAKWGGA
ncbi:hypothetical protein [Streptomyces sp. NPDC049906]|uniref:hypothetical protein n=1 Tax=Streptomyces sp. NPDC049906 TaxID=3155656 RepID=UPI003427437A